MIAVPALPIHATYHFRPDDLEPFRSLAFRMATTARSRDACVCPGVAQDAGDQHLPSEITSVPMMHHDRKTALISMTPLNPNVGYVVLISTITGESDKADMLFAELRGATKKGMKPRSGFVSANSHIGKERKHITNYAQGRSRTDIDATRADATAQIDMKHAADIATSFEPIRYASRGSVTV